MKDLIFQHVIYSHALAAHSYLSHKYGAVEEDKAKDAEMMVTVLEHKEIMLRQTRG